NAPLEGPPCGRLPARQGRSNARVDLGGEGSRGRREWIDRASRPMLASPPGAPPHDLMTRILRRFLLVVPLAIGLAAAHVPGGAQTVTGPASGRFAFADTTLLRDTLDLKFDRLFPLADSLGLAPDTLRALAARYRMSLAPTTFLPDSLRTPVDS